MYCPTYICKGVIVMKKIIIVTTSRKTKVHLLILSFVFCTILVMIIASFYILIKPENKRHASNRINLLEAYIKKDEKKVKQYFKDWNRESKKLTKTEYKDEIEESLYGIYKAVFHPYNMEPLLNYMFLDDYEYDLLQVINETPYVVTQDEIQYILREVKSIYDPDFFNYYILNYRINRNDIKSIIEFYPSVDIEDEKVLHLTDEYENELELFLGTKDHPLGEGNIMSPASPEEETLKRYQYIRNYIPILYGHWGGYWHISTHPELRLVYLDPDLDHAVAQYRIGYCFGYAEVKKVNGEWELVGAIMNGQE
jgi:hypothetical protein